MRRRTFLASVSVGVVAGTAGCSRESGSRADPPGGSSPATKPPTPASPDPVRRDTVSLPVPAADLYSAIGRDQIPAIVEPSFATDWDGLTDPETGEAASLAAAAPVIGIRRAGQARAYPLAVLNWHEIVNDRLGGPLIVSYCVLCGSAVVTERLVAGEPSVFGVSGKLWRSDLVMYDRHTGSLWSQLLATAIRGPRTGDILRILPSTLTTWESWRTDHPDTAVLLPPPASNTLRGPTATFDYFEPKYSYGDETQLIGLDSFDGRIHPKTLVIGITHGPHARAYPFHVVRGEGGVVNDRVGTRPVVIATTPDGSMVAFDRHIDGTVRRFTARGDRHLAAAGSRWQRTTGRAVDGPYAGAILTSATDIPPLFWYGWERFHPSTTVYGIDRPAHGPTEGNRIGG